MTLSHENSVGLPWNFYKASMEPARDTSRFTEYMCASSSSFLVASGAFLAFSVILIPTPYPRPPPGQSWTGSSSLYVRLGRTSPCMGWIGLRSDHGTCGSSVEHSWRSSPTEHIFWNFHETCGSPEEQLRTYNFSRSKSAKTLHIAGALSSALIPVGG